MKLIGYCLIRLSDSLIVREWRQLPHHYVIDTDDGQVAFHSDKLLGEDNLGHRLVENHMIDNPPGPFYAGTSLVSSFDGTRVVSTMQYPDSPNIVPESITPLQIRRALRASGMLDAVRSYIETQDDDIRDAWEYAQTIYRSDSSIDLIGSGIGMTPAQIDDLFRSASTK